jgi:hypothetical protein
MPLVIAGATSGSTTVQATDAVTATITLPSATTTLVGATTPSFTTTIGVGNATPSTSGAGITFPATQSASTNANTLDDYEEGTWTPGADDAGGNSFTAGVAVGRYVKVGNVVTANCYFTWTSKGSVNAGPMAISGLPFASNNTSNFSQAAVIGLASGFDTVVGTVQLAANNLANSTRINLLQITDNAGFNYLPANSCSNTGEISVSISYIV